MGFPVFTDHTKLILAFVLCTRSPSSLFVTWLAPSSPSTSRTTEGSGVMLPGFDSHCETLEQVA
jgi:hypothetical protein